VKVRVKLLSADARLPVYHDEADSGADLHSAAALTIEPGRWAMVPTGIAVELPRPRRARVEVDGEERWVRQVPEVQIRPRSGLAARHGICVLNAPGTIDCNYTDEWRVLLLNAGDDPFEINVGDRIAQAVFAWSEQLEFVATDAIDDTRSRGGGFGSSGR
jgi:dUTP pyrophosphatase